MNIKYILRQTVFTLLCMCCIVYCVRPVYAASVTEINQKSQLTLTYKYPNVKFSVYKVAELTETGEYATTEIFSKYKLDFSGTDSSNWRELAETLSGYVVLDNLQPIASKTTNSNGKVSFSDLEKGLYLVTGSQYTYGTTIYTAMPFLINLPCKDISDKWDYHVTVSPKYESNIYVPGAKTNFKVLKVWDNDTKKARPQSVEVSLLCDGKIYDSVMLNDENNWQYTWENLDDYKLWQLIERNVPQNYTVTCVKEKTTFVVTNTYHEPKKIEETTSPSNPTGNNPTNHDNPTGYDKPTGHNNPTRHNNPQNPTEAYTRDNNVLPTEEERPSGENVGNGTRLPQTGMLWWPVPLLAMTGVVIFAIGLRRHRDGSDCDEE